jgi:hypothetical protein
MFFTIEIFQNLIVIFNFFINSNELTGSIQEFITLLKDEPFEYDVLLFTKEKEDRIIPEGCVLSARVLFAGIFKGNCG